LRTYLAYLIDGNNVMGQRVGWHGARAGARRRLVGEVERLCGLRAVSAVVVFDGSPVMGESSSPTDNLEGLGPGTHVVFAGPDTDADSRIVALAATAPSPAEVLAVTSDRNLRERLAEHAVRVVRSGEFRRLLSG
jgi:predicted RNA-binding protein with PIN domain